MSDSRWHVHFFGGEKVQWALDEDLRLAREALADDVLPGPLASSRIVHSAYWPRVLDCGLGALQGKTVLCFADNPPAFNLTQPGFLSAASRVDLWIARTREAQAQFEVLGLPVARAPYSVDESIFRPIPPAPARRQELDIPEDAFVIGNFHRDSEGANLLAPKRQKGADHFLEIACRLHQRLRRLVVLLAGPRRSYLRRGLQAAGVPFRFVGTVLDDATDDYSVNILPRARLNDLYQFLDVCLISSRWEGGPHSLLESLFAGRPVVSSPVGMARDILPPSCLFRTIDEAVAILERHAHSHSLRKPTEAAQKVAAAQNTQAALRQSLLAIYAKLPRGAEPRERALFASGLHLLHRVKSRFGPAPEVENKRSKITGDFIRKLAAAPRPLLDEFVETSLEPTRDRKQSRRLLLEAAQMCQPRNQA